MKEVTLLGIGMGNINTLTLEGKSLIESSEVLIGAKRLIESIKTDLPYFISIDSQIIAEYINASNLNCFTVLFSGDTGFFSGANSLLPLLKGCDTKISPGISSLSYFSAKLGMSWEDAHILSLHGRKGNVVKAVKENRKTFLLTQGNIKEICQELIKAELNEAEIYIGENLSYPKERIRKGYPKDFIEEEFDSLSVLFIINKDYGREYKIGMKDQAFIRGDVPMTKSEVRAISISKLNIRETSVIYDIGAGTGSVTIEAALLADRGRVYAIEEKAEAVELIKQNIEQFNLDNVSVCQGRAPECLDALEEPDIAFIGGSKGNLRGIVNTLLKKNNRIRIVMNAITLETLMEALEVYQSFQMEEVEIVQAAISKTKELGSYHMLMGQNPVFIISGKGGGN